MTGLGAVTPVGNDMRTTWESAVAGRSGIDFIRTFDTTGFPVRIAAEVKGFDPTTVASVKEVRKLDRNVLLALAAATEAVGDAGLDGAYEPERVGILFGTAIGGFLGMMEQHDVLRERGPDRVLPTFLPSVLPDAASGQLAISLGYRGPNFAPVSACATGSTAVGESAEIIKRGDADAILAGGAEACMHPLILAGFCAMRGLVAEEEDPTTRVAAVRRDARRLRHGRGRLRARARGVRGGAAARSEDLRGDHRLRRVERRPPHGAARAGGDRGREHDARRARAHRASPPTGWATSTRTGRRRRSATRPRRRRSRTCSEITRTSWPCPRRSR